MSENVLTEELIINKSKNKELGEIKNLNIWGSDLEDISIIIKCYNLEVATFSANKIKTLSHFSFLPKLTELYLRKNNISDLNEIKFLKICGLLKILWLEGNPISFLPNYRKFIINELSHIQKLDNIPILPIERDNPSYPSNASNPSNSSTPNKKMVDSGHRVLDGINNKFKLSTNSSFKNNRKKYNSIVSVKSTSLNSNYSIKEKETQGVSKFLLLEQNNKESFKSKRINLTDNNFAKDSLDIEEKFINQQENFIFSPIEISNKNMFIVNAIKNLLEELNFTELSYLKAIIDKKLFNSKIEK
jgi:hypothetical protein